MEISDQGLLKDSLGREFLTQLIQSEGNMQIVAEKFWPLKLLLLGNDEDKNNIKTVHMNPYVQTHCHAYLSHYPHWQIQIHNSSSEAAKATKEFNHFSHAAIASKEAAQEYSLKIIDEQLFKKNHEPIMHFMVVTNGEVIFCQDNIPTKICISSCMMKIESVTLFQSILAEQKIKLSMLRQSANMPGYYYVDLEGMFQNHLQSFFDPDSIFKWLGNFSACANRNKYRKLFFDANIKF